MTPKTIEQLETEVTLLKELLLQRINSSWVNYEYITKIGTNYEFN